MDNATLVFVFLVFIIGFLIGYLLRPQEIRSVPRYTYAVESDGQRISLGADTYIELRKLMDEDPK